MSAGAQVLSRAETGDSPVRHALRRLSVYLRRNRGYYALWYLVVLLNSATFNALHAGIHVADLMTGRLGLDHWLIDAPGVFAPAILLAVLCLPRWWRDTGD